MLRGRPVRDALLEDPSGERFPWPAPPLNEILRGVELEGEGEKKLYEDLPADALRVFYFAAHWVKNFIYVYTILYKILNLTIVYNRNSR